MTRLSQNEETVVLRLRVRGSMLDPLTTRMRMTGLLAATRLHPAGLPPSAIVFVRKLRDPLPGAINLEQTNVQPPLAWERALAGSLDQMIRNAARPALGPVPASAESVLFLDRSELLACLAVDWCEGSAITRWWWQSFFRETDVTSAVISEWLDSIEYVPAALARLASSGRAVQFLRAMPPTQTIKLLKSVTERFGLTEMHANISNSISSAPDEPGTQTLVDQRRHPDSLSLRQASEKTGWSPPGPSSPVSNQILELITSVAPESAGAGLESHSRLLLVVGLLIERAPAVLRGSGFAVQLIAMALEDRGLSPAEPLPIPEQGMTVAPASEETLETSNHGVAVRHSTGSHSSSGLLENSAAEVRDRAPSLSNRSAVDSTDRLADRLEIEPFTGSGSRSETEERKDQVRHNDVKVGPRSVENDSLPRRSTPPQIADRGGDGHLNEQHLNAESESSPVATTAEAPISNEARNYREPAELVQTPVKSSPPMPLEASVQTELGGLFYLINAALYLGLYSDFTRPLEPGLALPVWDFLALIGHRLIGERFESDPVRSLLSNLSKRVEEETPGIHFQPPDEWRLPFDWLDTFEESAACEWERSNGRLRVEHPSGFVVLDIRADGWSASKQAAREARRYGSRLRFERGTRSTSRVNRRESPLERWTGWISDYLRARLGRSLGLAHADDLERALFAQQAVASVTPARLDIFFSLDRLPVEVRLSGLDRDPGWVPAAGRSIAFHYK